MGDIFLFGIIWERRNLFLGVVSKGGVMWDCLVYFAPNSLKMLILLTGNSDRLVITSSSIQIRGKVIIIDSYYLSRIFRIPALYFRNTTIYI